MAQQTAEQLGPQEWQATHRVWAWGGEIEVMLTVDGVAYTREEWEYADPAEIEVREDGNWYGLGDRWAIRWVEEL